MTQTPDRPGACLLAACTQQCTTECRAAINRTWTSLRGELPLATHLAPTEPVLPSETEQLQGGRRLRQTPDRPGIDHLTSDGLDQLYERLAQAEREVERLTDMAIRYSDRAIENGQRAERAEAERNTFREVARSNYQHVRAIVPELERAEATIERIRAELDNPLLHTKDPELQGERWLAGRIRAVLDQHGQTPA